MFRIRVHTAIHHMYRNMWKLYLMPL